MANGTTPLLVIRNTAKQYANVSGSIDPNNPIPVLEWNGYINASLAEFNDLVIECNLLNYLTSSQWVQVTGSQQPLPAGFYEANGMERLANTGTNQWTDVENYQWRDRNFGSDTFYPLLGSIANVGIKYNIINNMIDFKPANAVAGLMFQLWYYPQAPVLVNDTDEGWDDQQYWWDYVSVDAAIKALDSMGRDSSTLVMRKERLIARIQKMARNKNVMDSVSVGPKRGGGWGRGGWGSGGR